MLSLLFDFTFTRTQEQLLTQTVFAGRPEGHVDAFDDGVGEGLRRVDVVAAGVAEAHVEVNAWREKSLPLGRSKALQNPDTGPLLRRHQLDLGSVVLIRQHDRHLHYSGRVGIVRRGDFRRPKLTAEERRVIVLRDDDRC